MRSLILRFLLIQGLTCLNRVQSGILTDMYGNVAYGNGTISWADIPSGFSYKTVNNYDPGGLEGLYKMARGFINMIQPDPFPYGKSLLNLHLHQQHILYLRQIKTVPKCKKTLILFL